MDWVSDPAPLAAADSFALSATNWSDDNGTLPSLQAEARALDIGTNVGWFSGTGDIDSLIFINQAKGAWPFFLSGGTSTSQAQVTYDADGYPTNLPTGVTAVSQILNRATDLAGIEPQTGTFRLYGSGSGSIRIDIDGQGTVLKPTNVAGLPTETINGQTYWYKDFAYTPPGDNDTGVRLKISGVTPANYIHDISVVHHSHLDEFRAGEVFAPEFLQDLQNYQTLRFMEWMSAIRYEHNTAGAATDPEGRWISSDAFTFNTRIGSASQQNVFVSSAPIELIVDLANQVGADAWISLPVDITDARALQIANYVEANLDPMLKVYWEYGNELWNNAAGFEGYTYAAYMGKKTFGLTGNQAVVEWAAYRGPQLYDLIDGAMGPSASEARFVAPLFAFDPPAIGTWTNAASYSLQYFAAAKAQAMANAPSAPADIITDYATGMYVDGMPSDVQGYIATHYATDSERAEAQARWTLFGSRPGLYHELGTAALSAPETGVDYVEGMSISVSPLIRKDIQNGLDPLTGLASVLRLNGTALEYRGVNSASWTTVLQFSAVPGKTLAEMISDVELIGEGYFAFGQWRSGILVSLANAEWIRLEGHKTFVESLGLNWIAYEGGPAVGNQTSTGATWLDEYVDDGWAARVLNVWLDKMEAAGVDSYNHYMSHSRYADSSLDNWGAQRYAGQPLSDAPIAKLLNDTILASAGVSGGGGTGGTGGGTGGGNLLSVAQADMDVGAWTTGTNWTLNGDGSATETGGTNGTLSTAQMIPVTAGHAYRLSFHVDGSMAALGTLSVSVQVFGSGTNALANWEQKVVAGQDVVIDLGTVADPRDRLQISFRRRFAPSGTLAISNMLLSDLGTAAG